MADMVLPNKSSPEWPPSERQRAYVVTFGSSGSPDREPSTTASNEAPGKRSSAQPRQGPGRKESYTVQDLKASSSLSQSVFHNLHIGIVLAKLPLHASLAVLEPS